jgi:membrane dipeptidase
MTDSRPEASWTPTVAAVLAETPVFDGHNDLAAKLREVTGYGVEGLDREGQVPGVHTDLPRLRRGGVGAQFWSAWVPPTLPPGEAVQATFEQIDAIHRLVAAYPRDLAFARTADEVRQAWASGRIASLIGVEGGHSIGRSLAILRLFVALGVRYLTLTHTTNTGWADSGTDTPRFGGLSEEGKAVVSHMGELGILVDLSHTSEATQRDAIAVSRAPVVFSHSGASAVADHPRNVSDAVLRLTADAGGVVQVTFVPDFVSAAVAEWSAEFAEHLESRGINHGFDSGWVSPPLPGEDARDAHRRHVEEINERGGQFDFFSLAKEWETAHPRPRAGIVDVVRHVEHVREVAGIDHVGLGGDYDGVAYQPDGLEDVSCYPRLLAALAERGWSHQDLTALTGRNILRVLGDAQDVATR